jgi:Conjugal transfer protein TraD
MAGFDESALKRLEELVSKSKAGPKLPPAEALELKELKLLKSAAEIAKSRAEIEVAKRKMKDREKYRVGGLAVAAGLSAWTDEELKAAFATLVARGNQHGADTGTEAEAQPNGPAETENASAERLL